MHYSVQHGLIYPLFHRHCSYMMENDMFKTRTGELSSTLAAREARGLRLLGTLADRVYFNSLPSHASVIDYLRSKKIL